MFMRLFQCGREGNSRCDTEGADQKQMPEETSKESAAAVSRIPEIEAEPADADQIQKESSEQKKEANPVWFSDAMLEQAGLTGLEPPEEYTTSLAHVRNQLYYIEPRVNETTKEIERSYIYYEGAPEYPVECVFFVPKKGYIEKSDNPSKTMRSGIDLMRTYKEGFYDFLREKGYTIYYLNNAFAQILVELKDEDLGRGRKPYNAREEGYSTGLGNESDYSNGDGNIGLDNIRELFYTNGSEGGAVRFKLNIYQGGTDFTMELYSLEAWEYLTDFTAEGCSGVRDLDTSSDGIRRQFEVLFDDSCTVRDVYVIVNNLDDTEHQPVLIIMLQCLYRKAAVELYDMRCHISDILQIGIAGSEIIERNIHAIFFQFVPKLLDHHRVSDTAALCQLRDHARRLNLRLFNAVDDLL